MKNIFSTLNTTEVFVKKIKLFTTFILCITSIHYGMAQVHTGNLKLYTQADVNAFNYTKVIGNVVLYGNNNNRITDLTPLSNLEEVTGDLLIQYTSVTSLSKLKNLKKIGGQFFLARNNKLEVISDLDLQSIGTSLYIHRNDILNKVVFEELKTVTSLEVSNSDKILEFSFPKLTTIHNNLAVFSNQQLHSIDLSKLSEVKGSLRIYENKNLKNCCSISPLLNSGKAKTVTIYNNKDGCDNKSQIIDDCSTAPDLPLPIGSSLVLRGNNTRYITLLGNDLKSLAVNENNKSNAEVFQIVDAGNGKVALLASNNKYVTHDGSAIGRIGATANTIGDKEKFIIESLDNSGSFSIKASNGKFVQAAYSSGGVLLANSNSPKKFTQQAQ